MRAGAIAAMVGTILLGGALGSFFAAPAASATTVPLSFDFGVVIPGASLSETDPLPLPVRSVVSKATWVEHEGAADWTAALCDSAGACHDIDTLADQVLPAGDYTLSVSVTMPADAPQASIASATGVIRFTELPAALPLTGLPAGLPLTGSSIPWTTALAGVLALGAGTLFIIAAHRRRIAKEEDA